MIPWAANDTVLDYYPKYGFLKKEEYEYSMTVSERHKINLIHLDMNDIQSAALVDQHYAVPSAFAALSMIENEAIHRFYYERIFADQVWYDVDDDLVLCMERKEDTMVVYEILGTSKLSLADVVKRIAGSFEGIHQVSFMFTPSDTTNLTKTIHKEEDCTLFVQGRMRDIFDQKVLMIPKINHA